MNFPFIEAPEYRNSSPQNSLKGNILICFLYHDDLLKIRTGVLLGDVAVRPNSHDPDVRQTHRSRL